MTDGDWPPELVGQRLQADLPDAALGTVAAASSGQHQQFLRLRVARPALSRPPQADALDGEVRRVVAGANVDEAVVVAEVVDPVWDGLAGG